MIAYNHKVVFYPNGTVHLRKYKNPVVIQDLTEEQKADKLEKKLERMAEKSELLHELKETFPFGVEDKEDLKLFDMVYTADEIAKRKKKSEYKYILESKNQNNTFYEIWTLKVK